MMSTSTILLAEEHDATRAFLAENVARHIFIVLCPGRLCAGSDRPVMSGPAPRPLDRTGSAVARGGAEVFRRRGRRPRRARW